ncbi:hypothetical protein CF8_3456 [Nocardioides sp. CF8]|uniref:hypothetical protein n=1 Tax=Nocardioides sp. CF8 TaxID=110319 RepID=UPI00032FEE8A|nr:hypothetical protein [Nocardioides sp. CF8]EON22601.1 hypothetical protein CF8_3456 [Nocardioides sp. CF8]
MTCEPPQASGLSTNAGLLLAVTIACLVAGAAVVLLARRGHSVPASLGGLLLLGAGSAAIVLGWQAPGPPEESGCTSSTPDITVTQTSSMVGLAPGVAPVPVTGRLVNRSHESAHITTVDVRITSVASRHLSSSGVCTASDYQLIHPRMPVRLNLSPGSSTPFAGSFIGFANKPSNQDACQGAVVHLLYTVNRD